MFSHLRLLDESDLDWVMQVEKQSHSHPWSRGGFERALHQGLNFIIADQQDQALGYCCLLPVLDELHLLNLTVAPNFQRQGIAKQTMLSAFSRFESTQYQVMLLEVRRSNKVARHLYQQLGFAQDGVRKNYYQMAEGREDAILMSRALN